MTARKKAAPATGDAGTATADAKRSERSDANPRSHADAGKSKSQPVFRFPDGSTRRRTNASRFDYTSWNGSELSVEMSDAGLLTLCDGRGVRVRLDVGQYGTDVARDMLRTALGFLDDRDHERRRKREARQEWERLERENRR